MQFGSNDGFEDVKSCKETMLFEWNPSKKLLRLKNQKGSYLLELSEELHFKVIESNDTKKYKYPLK